MREGVLRPEPEQPTFTLTGVQIDGPPVPAIAHMKVFHDGFPPAKGTGVPEPTVVTFGHGLLSQYTTVWNWAGKVSHLCAP